jgi:hypothetical protein
MDIEIEINNTYFKFIFEFIILLLFIKSIGSSKIGKENNICLNIIPFSCLNRPYRGYVSNDIGLNKYAYLNEVNIKRNIIDK